MHHILKVLVLGSIGICSLQTLGAQKKGFHPGYVITKNGDTIRGWVKDRSPEPFEQLYAKIRFKPEGKSRTRRYAPEDIGGYGYQEQHFIAMSLREESTFFKFRYYSDAKAPISFLRVVQRAEGLWYLEKQFNDDDSSYIDAFPLFYRHGDRELVRVTQGIFGFKKQALLRYFPDCPELEQALLMGKPQITSVGQLFAFCVRYCAT